MRGSYGLQGYPVPPEDRLQTLAADLMDTDADLISNVMFNPIPRSDVGQGPLVQASASFSAKFATSYWEMFHRILILDAMPMLKIDHARLPKCLILW